MAMMGAILGDIAGSVYEFDPAADPFRCDLFTDRNFFTDDTVMTLATKYALMHNESYEFIYRLFGHKYPHSGYGGMFKEWIQDSEKGPYNSFGNGAAMRISYIADAFDDRIRMDQEVINATSVTHDHPEGIKGALVTANCIWMAKRGANKAQIFEYASKEYGTGYEYPVTMPLNEMRRIYRWNETCQGSVPVAIRCVYEADSFEGFLRNVISLPCDTDTIAAIGGGIAEELFGIKEFDDADIIVRYLDDTLRTIALS